MAQILNKIRKTWFEYLIKGHQTKYDFLVNFLPIKLALMDENRDKKLAYWELKKNNNLLKYEIPAGIESEFLKTEYEQQLLKINDKYYWKLRELNQKLKREQREDLEAVTALERAKQQEIDQIENRYFIKHPTKDAKEEYEVKLEEITTKYRDKITKYEASHNAKKAKLESRINTKIAKHKNLMTQQRAKLAQLEQSEKQYALDDNILLKIDNLSMHFGGLKAVDSLSFEVKRGEIFGLIGPNGAGKTTVFNCITRFYRPTAGNMYFRNKYDETTHLNKIVVHNIIKEGIARTFQNVEMVWELNVIENLLVAAHTNYRSGFFGHLFNSRLLRQEEAVMRKKAEKILTDLELLPYAYQYPYGLPYGILKKIELARTLMINPKLIILDEPAAGLNDAETETLAETIKKIQKEYDATIFLVEHDMGLVMNICDTVCAISFGKKLDIGTPKHIQGSKVVQEAYLGGE